jgi:uncharacterized membrane protein
MSPENASAPDVTIFSARLTPHRSLSERGFLLLMLLVSAVSFVAGLAFLLIGAWPVFGFFGLDVLLIYWAFRANYRGRAAREEITVTASSLIVRQISAAGAANEWALNPAWTRLESETDPDFGMHTLNLVSGGRSLPIARVLGPAEKESFAAALLAALNEARRGPTRTVFN